MAASVEARSEHPLARAIVRAARERGLHYEKLQSFRRFRATHKLDAAESAYYAHWFIPAVYELCACKDFDEDPRWIARSLLPPIFENHQRRAQPPRVPLSKVLTADTEP